MKTILASLTALAAAAALASPAAAGAPAAGPAAPDQLRLMQHVAYADLDLGRDADARRMANRLRRAAADLCESADISLARLARARACRHDALSQAVWELQAPKVAALLQDRSVG